MSLRGLRLAGVLGALLPATLCAQVRASERSTISQTIDGTVISVDYARPRLRDRSPIFGKVVRWGEVWTPGANWATVLEASRPIELGGRAVPAGKYSVWLVVRQAGAWTLVLDPDHHRFHMDPPDSGTKQIRISVTPVRSPRTEVLTWSFPEIRVSGGTLAMQWADTMISAAIKVAPSYGITMARDAAEPFLGRYTFAYVPRPGEKADTTQLVLTYEKGSLYGNYIPRDEYMGSFVMIRIADGSLIPGLFEKGEIYEVIRD
ncbi:MAG TPA: DUF2911 domain-containing protein, partial [Gemmatimonadales bacterium]|nr:DUF2911 domain-containing protein [Gemmatimonadales bacterium]